MSNAPRHYNVLRETARLILTHRFWPLFSCFTINDVELGGFRMREVSGILLEPQNTEAGCPLQDFRSILPMLHSQSFSQAATCCRNNRAADSQAELSASSHDMGKCSPSRLIQSSPCGLKNIQKTHAKPATAATICNFLSASAQLAERSSETGDNHISKTSRQRFN